MTNLNRLNMLLGLAVVAFGLALAACGGSGASTQTMTSANICPNNPTLCGGTCCGDNCVDTTSDSNNCGGCGTVCPSTSGCTNSTCGCPPSGNACGAGQTCCGTSGCKSIASDINNCGACGVVCAAGESCVDNKCACGTKTCASGQMCCNGECSSSCSVVDMSPPGDMAGCACTKSCILKCVDGCCEEDILTCIPNIFCS